MTIPLRMVVRGAALAAAEKSSIEALANGLVDFFPRLLSCEVHVDGPGGHHRQGMHQVRLHLSVPTRSIVISRQKGTTLQDVLVEAFRSAGRRLEDHARRVRGDVKRRSGSKQGRVIRLFPNEGYGFLESSGREIYFHRHSVLSPGFERLAIGTRVRFSEEPGLDGPQASTLSIIRPKRLLRRG